MGEEERDWAGSKLIEFINSDWKEDRSLVRDLEAVELSGLLEVDSVWHQGLGYQ